MRRTREGDPWKRNEKGKRSTQKTREGDPWKRNEKGQILSLKRKDLTGSFKGLLGSSPPHGLLTDTKSIGRDTLKICRILLVSFVCIP